MITFSPWNSVEVKINQQNKTKYKCTKEEIQIFEKCLGQSRGSGFRDTSGSVLPPAEEGEVTRKTEGLRQDLHTNVDIPRRSESGMWTARVRPSWKQTGCIIPRETCQREKIKRYSLRVLKEIIRSLSTFREDHKLKRHWEKKLDILIHQSFIGMDN